MEWNLNFELGSKVFEIEKNVPNKITRFTPMLCNFHFFQEPPILILQIKIKINYYYYPILGNYSNFKNPPKRKH
jgi:hypothetical protein